MFKRLVHAFALCLCCGAVLAQDADLEVVSLTLIDADTNEAIGELHDGMIVDFDALGTGNLSVVASTRPDIVGSVTFELNGEPIQLENVAPYAIAGDSEDGTDFHPWTPPLGENALTATPYAGRNARGRVGRALTVRFSVVGEAPRPTAEGREVGFGRMSFPVLDLAESGLRGSVLVSDYDTGEAIVNILVTNTLAGESYPARLHVGNCADEGGVLFPLDSVRGGSGLSTTYTPLFYQGLVRGDFHVRIYSAAGEVEVDTMVACAEIGR